MFYCRSIFTSLNYTSLGNVVCGVSPENCDSQKSLTHSIFSCSSSCYEHKSQFKTWGDIVFIQRSLCSIFHFFPTQYAVVPLSFYLPLGRSSPEMGNFRSASLLVCCFSSYIAPSPWYLVLSWKTLKKEQYSAVLPVLGAARLYQMAIVTIAVVTSVGVGHQLPCTNNSHWLALAPGWDTSWKVFSQG